MNFSEIIKKSLKAVSHCTFISFLLVLPVGYYPDSGDSSDVAIGLYGGHGQVASVLRDCSGKVLQSEASKFTDVSGAFYVPVHRNPNSVITFGLKGGYWNAPRAGFAFRDINGDYGRTADSSISYSYINPNICLEFRTVGIGIGYLDGVDRFAFENYQSLYDDKIPVSGHLRFGYLDNYYFLISLQENLPLASGGGYFDIGIGYGEYESLKSFTGLSFGFYERPGFIQQFRFKTKSHFDFDLSIRLGKGGGKTENAISAGVLFKLGK